MRGPERGGGGGFNGKREKVKWNATKQALWSQAGRRAWNPGLFTMIRSLPNCHVWTASSLVYASAPLWLHALAPWGWLSPVLRLRTWAWTLPSAPPPPPANRRTPPGRTVTEQWPFLTNKPHLPLDRDNNTARARTPLEGAGRRSVRITWRLWEALESYLRLFKKSDSSSFLSGLCCYELVPESRRGVDGADWAGRFSVWRPDAVKKRAVFSEPQLVQRLPPLWWCHGCCQQSAAAPMLSPLRLVPGNNSKRRRRRRRRRREERGGPLTEIN